MGFEWRGTRPREFTATIGAKGIGGMEAIKEILEHVGEDGAEDMVRFIETTPSAIVPGKDNRVWTGQMRDDVNHTPVQVDGKRASVKFGWTGNVEDYYLEQEHGGDYIPTPMHALQRAFIIQREGLIKLLQEWTKR